MKYSRKFIGLKETKQKDDFIARIRKTREVDGSEQLDYQEHDGFRRWLYFTPKFSPSGFVTLTEVGTLMRCSEDSLKPAWEVIIETSCLRDNEWKGGWEADMAYIAMMIAHIAGGLE